MFGALCMVAFVKPCFRDLSKAVDHAARTNTTWNYVPFQGIIRRQLLIIRRHYVHLCGRGLRAGDSGHVLAVRDRLDGHRAALCIILAGGFTAVYQLLQYAIVTAASVHLRSGGAPSRRGYLRLHACAGEAVRDYGRGPSATCVRWR